MGLQISDIDVEVAVFAASSAAGYQDVCLLLTTTA